MKTTGHGATISFANPDLGFNYPVRSFDLQQESSENVDASDLSSGPLRDYLPADLMDQEAFTLEYLLDPEQGFPTRNTKADCTITLPISNSANLTPATYTGKAWISSIKHPTLNTNEVAAGTLGITWETLPTFTPEAG